MLSLFGWIARPLGTDVGDAEDVEEEVDDVRDEVEEVEDEVGGLPELSCLIRSAARSDYTMLAIDRTRKGMIWDSLDRIVRTSGGRRPGKEG